MVEVNESLAGDPSALPASVHEWAANMVYQFSKEQGSHPVSFTENVQGEGLGAQNALASEGASLPDLATVRHVMKGVDLSL
jgi:hypothetical protein